MKSYKLLLNFLWIGLLLTSCQDKPQGFYDDEAIATLDKITEIIGGLNSVSLYIEAENTNNGDTTLTQSDVYLKGNNKMHLIAREGKNQKGYWYNGEKLSVFRYNSEEYDEVPAPATSIETIDSAHRTYGVRFPAADFFYPTLTDDLINDFDSIVMLESVVYDELTYSQLRATNADTEVIITIDQSTSLPAMLEIYSRKVDHDESYIGKFSNWRLNPKITDDIFTFIAPKDATKANLLSSKK
jgi:hypothetical protein